MGNNFLLYSPDTPETTRKRVIEFSYQLLLLADVPEYLRHCSTLVHSLQMQALRDADTRLIADNRDMLGLNPESGSLTRTLPNVPDALREMMPDRFMAFPLALPQRRAKMEEIASSLAASFAGDARVVSDAARIALREGCSPLAVDPQASLREALYLLRVYMQHPPAMRDYVAWFNIGWLLWKLDGDLGGAEKAFLTAVRQSNEQKDTYHVLAACHLAYVRLLQNKITEASHAIRLALQVAGDNAENLYTQMLIAARASSPADLTISFFALCSRNPEWLAHCLSDIELESFFAQLQPVVNRLREDVRAKVSMALSRFDAVIAEAHEIAGAINQPSLLAPLLTTTLAAFTTWVNGVNVETADWFTMNRLILAADILCRQVEAAGKAVRPRLPILRTIDWIQIPEGDFLYGDEKAPMYLPAFHIMKYPVTVAQYRQFCAATDRQMPMAPDWGWQDRHPIVNVCYHDALAFALWAGLDLPGEQEWEKAARGIDGREYPWGDEWDASKCCNGVGGAEGQTSPVSAHAHGASPFGVEDMAGNVWEWCESWYERNKTRVLRGGCWLNSFASSFRAASRDHDYPTDWYSYHGFRCVLRP